MNKKLLKLLEQDARYTMHDLAVMLDTSEDEIRSEIEQLKKTGVIRGFKTVIDWERLDSAYVSALIELKVPPRPITVLRRLPSKLPTTPR